MTRLASTMHWDVRLQFRNGFYYAAGVVAVFCIALLSWLSEPHLAWILPPFVLGNLLVNTFYFLGGLVLLEKREGTLEAQIVTPLRTWEYLASKVATLAALSLIENLSIVILTHGPGFGVLPLVAGIASASALYALLGFVAVARYDSINEYLPPSLVYAALFSIPMLPYFGVWESPLFYLHPMQAPLLLMKAAFEPVRSGLLLYGALYGLAWIAPLFLWSRGAFARFIVAKEGVR